MSEIEKQIVELRKQANGLYKYARILAHKKGVKYPKKHGANWFFDDGWLRVRWDDFHPNLSVHAYDEWVMNFTSGQCTRFRKGKWVRHLIQKAAPLLAAECYTERRKERMREYRRLESWGLEHEIP